MSADTARRPVPASSTSRGVASSSWTRATHEVLPPTPANSAPTAGVEPRTPQRCIRTSRAPPHADAPRRARGGCRVSYHLARWPRANPRSERPDLGDACRRYALTSSTKVVPPASGITALAASVKTNGSVDWSDATMSRPRPHHCGERRLGRRRPSALPDSAHLLDSGCSRRTWSPRSSPRPVCRQPTGEACRPVGADIDGMTDPTPRRR